VGGYQLFEARYRRWLDDDTGVDLGIDVVRDPIDDRWGAMVVAGYEFRDLFALTASPDSLPYPTGCVVGGNVGVRVGAKPIGYALYGIVAFFAALEDISREAVTHDRPRRCASVGASSVRSRNGGESVTTPNRAATAVAVHPAGKQPASAHTRCDRWRNTTALVRNAPMLTHVHQRCGTLQRRTQTAGGYPQMVG
jgi:hypothetical protein